MGFLIGVAVGQSQYEFTHECADEVVAVTYEDRNGDTLRDQVQEFDDGSELVLYAHINPQGNIEYKLRE